MWDGKKVGSLCGKKWDSSKIYYLYTFFEKI